jgi:hypothetical protein
MNLKFININININIYSIFFMFLVDVAFADWRDIEIEIITWDLEWYKESLHQGNDIFLNIETNYKAIHALWFRINEQVITSALSSNYDPTLSGKELYDIFTICYIRYNPTIDINLITPEFFNDILVEHRYDNWCFAWRLKSFLISYYMGTQIMGTIGTSGPPWL